MMPTTTAAMPSTSSTILIHHGISGPPPLVSSPMLGPFASCRRPVSPDRCNGSAADPALGPLLVRIVSCEYRTRVEGDANPGDASGFDMAPVDDGHRPCGSSTQLEPCQDLRSVD